MNPNSAGPDVTPPGLLVEFSVHQATPHNQTNTLSYSNSSGANGRYRGLPLYREGLQANTGVASSFINPAHCNPWRFGLPPQPPLVYQGAGMVSLSNQAIGALTELPLVVNHMKEMLGFLKDRYQNQPNRFVTYDDLKKYGIKEVSQNQSSEELKVKQTCVICRSKDHGPNDCEKFVDTASKIAFLRESNRCLICLSEKCRDTKETCRRWKKLCSIYVQRNMPVPICHHHPVLCQVHRKNKRNKEVSSNTRKPLHPMNASLGTVPDMNTFMKSTENSTSSTNTSENGFQNGDCQGFSQKIRDHAENVTEPPRKKKRNQVFEPLGDSIVPNCENIFP